MNVRGRCGGRGSLRGILALGALSILVAGCASHAKAQARAGHPTTTTRSTPAPAPPVGTKVESFRAYDATGRLTVKVADVADGRCWTNSLGAPAADTFRCFKGDNVILDPCFARPGASAPAEVACVLTPWSEATVLRLTEPLPKSDPIKAVKPWALLLRDGQHCVASTGMVPTVSGVDLDYQCGTGHGLGGLKMQSQWATAMYADLTSQTVHPVTVATIWRS
jgi:hypothetical protein